MIKITRDHCTKPKCPFITMRNMTEKRTKISESTCPTLLFHFEKYTWKFNLWIRNLLVNIQSETEMPNGALNYHSHQKCQPKCLFFYGNWTSWYLVWSQAQNPLLGSFSWVSPWSPLTCFLISCIISLYSLTNHEISKYCSGY